MKTMQSFRTISLRQNLSHYWVAILALLPIEIILLVVGVLVLTSTLTRQMQAALEVRRRLAMKVFDRLQPLVFATKMQVGAARELLGIDPACAEDHLEEAEQLVSQAQHELTALASELHSGTSISIDDN